MWLATPTPQTSLTRFPRAAEASVDRPSLCPKVTSICSPAMSCTTQATDEQARIFRRKAG